jgi:phosphopantothenate-cysteine ligase
VTIFDYLFLLRGAARALNEYGSRAMIYSAAAVSDFFLPPENMVWFESSFSIP